MKKSKGKKPEEVKATYFLAKQSGLFRPGQPFVLAHTLPTAKFAKSKLTSMDDVRFPRGKSYGGGGQGGAAGAAVVVVSNATFDLATVAAVTLSGGNLVATNTGTTSTNQGAKIASASGKTTGKYYFEYTITTYTGGAGVGAGVATVAATYANVSILSAGNAGNECFVVGHTGTGTISSDSGNTGLTLGVLANGDVLCVAADLTNRRIWFRKGAAGLWNGIILSSSDPTVGDGSKGGSPIAAGTIVPLVTFGSGPAGAAGVANNVITANFGASAFVGAVPSGYTSGWPQ